MYVICENNFFYFYFFTLPILIYVFNSINNLKNLNFYKMEINNRNQKSFLNEEINPSNTEDVKITRNIEIDYDDQVNYFNQKN